VSSFFNKIVIEYPVFYQYCLPITHQKKSPVSLSQQENSLEPDVTKNYLILILKLQFKTEKKN